VPAPIAVRPATRDDAPAVASLLGELGYPTAPALAGERLAALAGDDDAVLLAIDERGEAVGLISLHRMRVLHAGGLVAYITALVTASSARGRGVGRALLESAERWARAAGCRRLTVTSAERRADAHAFYEACGMPYTGRRFAKQLD
jgi:GNAT superfamily N-acetyltransferase